MAKDAYKLDRENAHVLRAEHHRDTVGFAGDVELQAHVGAAISWE